jgi:hypothetical protein
MYKKKMLVLGIAFGMSAAMLTACGGGSSDSNAGNVLHAPKLSIALFGTSSMAGKPVSSSVLKSLNPISQAHADGQGDDAAAALQDALTQAGVAAQVKVGVMDAATLHDYVALNYGTTLPTPEQLAQSSDPTTWVIENFTINDLKGFTQMDAAGQQAVLDQFAADLKSFIKWQHVAGNWIVMLDTDPSSDADVNWAVDHQINQIIAQATSDGASLWTMNGVETQIVDWQSHMSGPDGNTPDDYMKTVKTNELVRQSVILNGFLNPTTPAAPASDASPASAAEPASAASS